MLLALPSIQALDLSGSHITEFPISIQKASNLSFLDLSYTLIEKLPESISCLSKLQTLKLIGCKHLNVLPEGMKELVSLRHLEFDILSPQTLMPRDIGALKELRTLPTFIVGTEKGYEISELGNLINLRGSLFISGLERVSQMRYRIYLKYLTHLQLRWTEYESSNQFDAHKILELFLPTQRIQELRIVCYPGSIFPSWIRCVVYDKLVRITLIKCANTSLKITLGVLPNLAHLSITQMNQLSVICEDFRGLLYHAVGFPKLEQLEIDGMLSLESWTGVKPYDFPLLAKFSIRHCPKLTELPFLPMLPSLNVLEISSCDELIFPEDKLPASLQSLIIDECPLLKRRCSNRGEDWHKIKHVPHIWIDLIDYSPHDDSATEDESWVTDSQSEDDELVSRNELNEACNKESAEEQDRERKNDVRDIFKEELQKMFSTIEDDIKYYMDSLEDMIFFCFIFSHDYEFDEETLIQLWVARGYIKNEHKNLMIGNRYFQILLSTNHIVPTGTCIESKKEKYKANVDMFKDDLASLTESKNALCHKGDLHVLVGEDEDELCSNSLISKKFDSLKALFLCKNASRISKIPKEVFNARKLEVLHLGGTRIKELSSSIGNLVELRYLDLSCTRIKELPDEVNALTKLQILKLNNCKRLFRLPEEMARLTSLEHLELDVLSQLATMPRRMGALTKLETLSAFLVQDVDGHRIEELKNLNHLKGTFCVSRLKHVLNPSKAEGEEALVMRQKNSIKELELRWTDSHETWDTQSSDHHHKIILQSLHPNSNLEQLRISCYGGAEFPEWISHTSFNMLTTISLYKCANATKLPSLGELPSLKLLSLMEMQTVEKIGSEFRGSRIPAFPMLEKLEIIGFSDLNTWNYEATKEEDYQHLCKLVIEQCPKLTEVPSTLLQLRSLEHLEILNCGAMRLQKTLSTSLKTLIVDDCPLVTKDLQESKPEDWVWIKHVENVWIDQEEFVESSQLD